ncbi:MAG: prohibitin family protein [Acetobacteraceae bacterium]
MSDTLSSGDIPVPPGAPVVAGPPPRPSFWRRLRPGSGGSVPPRPPASGRPRRWWNPFPPIGRWFQRHITSIIFGVLVFVILFIILWNRIVYNIPPGSVGVLWLRFFGGTVTEFHYSEGIHAIFPWDKIYIYDTRLQRLDQQVIGLTEDGLPVEIQISLTYAVSADQIGVLHKALGPQYETSLIVPTVNSQITLMIASRRAEALYSLGRTEVDTAVMTAIRNRIEKQDLNTEADGPLFKLEDINIRRVQLPVPVQQAIEDKLTAEQAVLRYTYVLERERLESQRKGIEAQGIRAFQDIVTPGITDSYLRWQGIDATLKLATSQNSKVVIIGSGPNGLPIILDGTDGGRSTAGAPPRRPTGIPSDNAPQSSSGPASLSPPSDNTGPAPLASPQQSGFPARVPLLAPPGVVAAPSTAPPPQTAPPPATSPPPQTAPRPDPAGQQSSAGSLTFVPTIFPR